MAVRRSRCSTSFYTCYAEREKEGWKAKPGLKVTDNFGGSTDRSCGSTDKKLDFLSVAQTMHDGSKDKKGCKYVS